MTGIERLDPIVALAVGLNIVITGYKLLRDSALALIDGAMPAEENEQLASILAGLRSDDVDFHGLRTRVSGHRGFAEVHVLVPGDWSVTQGHDLAERIEQAVISELPDVTVSTHVEPREDPRSYDDYETEIPIAPATP